jgi:hypothetical protein
MSRRLSARWGTFSLAIAALMGGPVREVAADVILGSSSAFGTSGLLTFTPNLPAPLNKPVTLFASPPAPFVGASAPAPYVLTKKSLGLALPPVTISSQYVVAGSDVDGLPGGRYASSRAIDRRFTLSPLFGLLLPPILSVSVTTLDSLAIVHGDYGFLQAFGSTAITGQISIPILGINAFGFSAPPPNKEIGDPAAGLSILLNEQTITGNGISGLRIDVNAIDISFTNFAVTPAPGLPALGFLNGDFIFGHADALLVATPPASTPEPASLVLASIGGIVLSFWARRSRLSVALGTPIGGTAG